MAADLLRRMLPENHPKKSCKRVFIISIPSGFRRDSKEEMN